YRLYTYRTTTTSNQLICILFFRAESLKLTSISNIVIILIFTPASKCGRLIKLPAVLSSYTNKNTCEVISPYISPYANGGFFLVY
ncbi:hypothetical protein DX868_25140, partial [Escherichia coli]